MTTSAVAPAMAPVPMLDVHRQNGPLAPEIDAAIAEVIRTGTFINGPACRDFETAFAKQVGVEHAIGCASGSDALLLALLALGIGTGDEVLLPSFTFFATAGAVWRTGAKPVFVEILPDTFNIDPADAARRITPATKALLPVHLFGQSSDMQSLQTLAEKHDLAIIEDACQAIGATQEGKQVGAMGDFGAFSFYPTKNLGGFGDGGMVTTNNADHAETLRRLRNHGQHPRYHHHLVGVNSRLDAIQAAALHVKLPLIDSWGEARCERADRYNREFTERGLAEHLELPTVTAGVTSVWNQYTVRVKNGRRDELQQALTTQGIGAAIYYPVPLHMQACFAPLGCQQGDLPHTELAADEVLSLPVFPELTADEQTRVIDAVSDFCQSGSCQSNPCQSNFCSDSETDAQASTPATPAAGANIDLPEAKA